MQHFVPPQANEKIKKRQRSQPLVSRSMDEVDAALKAAGVARPGRCNSCSANAALVGLTCKLCRLRFCVAHSTPESHGCGKAAAASARAAWLAPKPKAKPPTELESRLAREALNAKLDAAKLARSKKKAG